MYAATQLSFYLSAICGVDLPIVSPQDVSGPVLAVGYEAAVQAGLASSYLQGLGDEGFVLQTFSCTTGATGTALSGGQGSPRGTLYAVNQYLTQQLGVRFYAADETYIPQCTYFLPDVKVKYVPQLEYRSIYAQQTSAYDWATRNFNNMIVRDSIPASRGGYVKYASPPGLVHTSYPLVPPDQYFKTNPEWYALRDGQRQSDNSQLCWTNTSLQAFLIDRVRSILRADPDANIISVSQNDNTNDCECPVCTAANTEDDSHIGSLLRTVNKVADAIKDDFPHVAVDTLAYQYTRKPPKVTVPRDNVIVRLCSIECNFGAPLTDPSNKAFAADITNWSAISQRLYIWDYVTNFANYVMPFPNWAVLGDNVRFFVSHGVKGIFEEANYGSRGGDVAELKTWMLSQLLWDPTANDTQLVQDFVTGYYGGGAAPYVLQYLWALHESVVANQTYMAIYVGIDSGYLTPAVVLQSCVTLSAARKACDRDTCPERIDVLRMAVYYVLMQRWNEMQTYAQQQGMAWPAEATLPAAFEEFARIYNAAGVTQLSEDSFSLEDLYDRLFPAPSH